MDLQPGMLARSKAGHDKGCIYIIIDVNNEYVYLSDGETRPVLRPKRKNRKHIQPIRIMKGDCLSDDAAVRDIIRKYTRSAGKA